MVAGPPDAAPSCAPRVSWAGQPDAVAVDPEVHVRARLHRPGLDAPRALEPGERPPGRLLGGGVDVDERVALAHLAAHRRHDRQAGGVVDGVVLAEPAAAEVDHRQPACQRVDAGDPAVRRPAPSPIWTISDASSQARWGSGTNAPRPNFTSSTIASAPAASFLDITLDAISGTDGTVAVTSRRA